MIVIDKDNKNLVIPNGLGNINRDYQEGYEIGYQESFEDGKAEGLAEGRAEGLVEGKAIGIEEGKQIQKDLLEAITITENGTYNKEDGYNQVVVDVLDLNGDYNEGYQAGIDYASENAGEIAAENAIVLDVTEIRTYYTKYSDNIVNPNPVTGIYPDDEKFYNLGVLSNIIYNTGVYINNNSIIEFWYKGDGNNTDDGWNQILNAESKSDERSLALAYTYSNNNKLRLSWGGSYYEIYWDDNVLNHLIISSNGVFLNDEKVVDIKNTTFTTSVPCVINGMAFNLGIRRANGSFGMIKITTDGIENIIIPTEDGFKNITTDELLEVVYNEGTYKYINNDPIILDNLIKQVNVNTKINVVENKIKLGYSTFTEVPDFYDFSYITNMKNMFNSCDNLQTIPLIDTSNVTDMMNMFQDCKKLTTIPALDTSNVIFMDYMFSSCNNLVSIPPLNANKLILGNYNGLFYFTTMNKLTDFGGLIGLKSKSNNDYTFVRCPNLTYQSCINILNGLYDFTGNGETPTSDQGQLKVHQNFLDLVGDEISIGTNKGWTITA